MPPAPVSHPSPSVRRQAPGWLYIRAFWASLSIVTMWMVVLFVGIFGDDFVVNNSSGYTNIPVVIFLLPFVLAGTIVIGRRGFAGAAADMNLSRNGGVPTARAESAEPPDSHAKAA